MAANKHNFKKRHFVQNHQIQKIVKTKRTNWPMEFDRNGKILNNKPNNFFLPTSKYEKIIYILIYRKYHVLQKNSGAIFFYRIDNLTPDSRRGK